MRKCCWPTRIGKVKLVRVNDATTCQLQTFGDKWHLALFSPTFYELANSHLTCEHVLLTLNQSKSALSSRDLQDTLQNGERNSATVRP